MHKTSADDKTSADEALYFFPTLIHISNFFNRVGTPTPTASEWPWEHKVPSGLPEAEYVDGYHNSSTSMLFISPLWK
jgi:hypothetical protein